MEEQRTELSVNLDRIINLYGVDEGFYVLSLFSWIECYICMQDPHIAFLTEKFSDKLRLFFEQMTPEQHSYSRLLFQLSGGHHLTNGVRHQFKELTKHEAISMTSEFINFCMFVDWSDPKLDTLRGFRAAWDDKFNPVEDHQRLYHLRQQMQQALEENQELKRALAEHTVSHDELERLKAELKQRSDTLHTMELKLQKQHDKQDKLRKDLFDVREKKKQLDRELEELRFKEDYLTYMERFTFYTRSRYDYERALMRLTPEQLRISSRIRDFGDYLVKGSAGTGKTLVLLHALLSHQKAAKEQFDFSAGAERYLLTYTNALVHFNSYLAALFADGEPEFKVETVDEFFLERLKRIDPDYSIDYHFLDNRITDDTLPFLTGKELNAELETAIFGRDTSHDDYILVPGVRAGMKKALSRNQKEAVWELALKIREEMDEKKGFSKGYSRLVLLQALQQDPSLASELSVKRIYLDEVQDLSPVGIQLLSLLSEEGLVMAGDETQAIYQAGFSFQKLGVNIIGHASTLLLNYRNTRQIHHLAEMYRFRLLPGEVPAAAQDASTDTFRDGPSPELWLEDSVSGLFPVLMKRIQFFLETLGYEPENLAVLVPSNDLLARTKGALEKAGLAYKEIKARDFDFRKDDGIRISTIHSAKGVEFPVVMLFIPKVTVSSRLDQAAAENSTRRLLYVSMTRCIDNLQVFSLYNAQQPLINEFLDVYHDYEDGMASLEY